MSNSNVRTDINALNLSDQESDSGSKHIEKYTLSRPGSSSSNHEKARTVALQNELQSVQNINQVIEGILDSLDRARNNVESVSRTVDSASTLLNSWTRILSQAEQNQRLILNHSWQGTTQDITNIENEAIFQQQERERRQQDLQKQNETMARKAEEAHKKEKSAPARGVRGVVRGRSHLISRVPTAHSSVNGQGSVRGTFRGSIPRGPTTASRAGRNGSRGVGATRGRVRSRP